MKNVKRQPKWLVWALVFATIMILAFLGGAKAIFGQTFPETSAGLKISWNRSVDRPDTTAPVSYRAVWRRQSNPMDSVFKDGPELWQWWDKSALPNDSLLFGSVYAYDLMWNFSVESDRVPVHFTHVYIPPISDFPYSTATFDGWNLTNTVLEDRGADYGVCLQSVGLGSIGKYFTVGKTANYRITLTYSGYGGQFLIGGTYYDIPNNALTDSPWGWKTHNLDVQIQAGQIFIGAAWGNGYNIKSIGISELTEGDNLGPRRVGGVNVTNQK